MDFLEYYVALIKGSFDCLKGVMKNSMDSFTDSMDVILDSVDFLQYLIDSLKDSNGCLEGAIDSFRSGLDLAWPMLGLCTVYATRPHLQKHIKTEQKKQRHTLQPRHATPPPTPPQKYKQSN